MRYAKTEYDPQVKAYLTPDPERRVQSFEYYAAHFILGSGLLCADPGATIRAWAHELKLQYDLGVEHGLRHPGHMTYSPPPEGE